MRYAYLAFLSNPHELRRPALRLSYPERTARFRAAIRSTHKVDCLIEQVPHIVGERLAPMSPLQSHAKCRLTLTGDVGRGKVYIDRSHWSGILYLSRPEGCRGGTESFHHRRVRRYSSGVS